ncbi:hypothetical protein JXC34_04835 [Candidatus Woesearchaeota archaeon]|nr:hypothetical protein [Candidatus Woesearchaeota archaeon]
MEMKPFIKSRKAVFFTFIALFVIILVLSIVSTKDSYRYREKSNTITSRVSTMNAFVSDMKEDFEREIFIGGYRALLSMNAYIRIKEEYIEDFDFVYAAILVNGSLNGTSFDLMSQDTKGADINSWIARINEEASALNIIIGITVNNITMRHVSPWLIELTLDADFNVSDTRGLASWNFNEEFTRQFSIKGVEDPLYTVGTEDRVTNLINQTPDLDFVGSGNDTAVLNMHLNNSYYAESTDAPSFLMRFTGNFSASPYGIESMINLEKLSAQSIPIKSRSVIDYIYFGSGGTTDYCTVQDMPTWFRIDSGNLAFYEVTGLSKTLCT